MTRCGGANPANPAGAISPGRVCFSRGRGGQARPNRPCRRPTAEILRPSDEGVHYTPPGKRRQRTWRHPAPVVYRSPFSQVERERDPQPDRRRGGYRFTGPRLVPGRAGTAGVAARRLGGGRRHGPAAEVLNELPQGLQGGGEDIVQGRGVRALAPSPPHCRSPSLRLTIGRQPRKLRENQGTAPFSRVPYRLRFAHRVPRWAWRRALAVESAAGSARLSPSDTGLRPEDHMTNGEGTSPLPPARGLTGAAREARMDRWA
jgi:hypothetical protein